MNYYFNIQFLMIQRNLRAFGIQPHFGMMLIALLFFGSTTLLLSRFEVGSYVLMIFFLSVMVKLSDRKRADFIRHIFPELKFRKIRMIENGLLITPLIILLMGYQHYWGVGCMLIISIGLSLVNLDLKISTTLPTPFSFKPFEFVVGFRKFYYLLVLALFLTIAGVVVHNFSLSAFGLLLTFIFSFYCFQMLEPLEYVWVYATTPARFLRRKLWMGFVNAAFLWLPIVVVIGLFFPTSWMVVGGIVLVGHVYLALIVFSKYSCYPLRINTPNQIIIMFCFIFPFLLIGMLPYFFRRSVSKLNLILV